MFSLLSINSYSTSIRSVTIPVAHRPGINFAYTVSGLDGLSSLKSGLELNITTELDICTLQDFSLIMPEKRETFEASENDTKESLVGCLTRDQLRQFTDQGFVVLENFFDTEKDLEPLKQDIERMVAYTTQQLLMGGKITNAYKSAGLFDRLTHVNNEYPGSTVVWRKDHHQSTKPFRHIWTNERLLNIIEQLVGPNVAGHGIWNIRTKLPSNTHYDVPWHQDSGYFEPPADNTLIPIVWIPLLDSAGDNGCLQFIPGSHKRKQVVKHKACWKDTWYLYIDDEDLHEFGVDPTEAVTCPVPYGGLVLFTNWTIHRSISNVSDKIRWSLDLRFHNAEQPHGFAKNSIQLRKRGQPNFTPDWDQFDAIDRTTIVEDHSDPFETRISPGLWAKRWELVNENRHTKAWTGP